jgi:hypothetical protein
VNTPADAVRYREKSPYFCYNPESRASALPAKQLWDNEDHKDEKKYIKPLRIPDTDVGA